MSKKTLSTLWIITGLVALILAAATIGLAAKARTKAILNSTVYLNRTSSLNVLHDQPDRFSRIIATLKRGTAVTVRDFAAKDGQTWYYVEASTASGWVEAEYVSLNSP
ncbi:MAG: SH3 domain-containing protein [Anaerolineales bacterium]|nr:SH3 domain-containing protein [Anaerolineales bacterium]